LLTTQSILGEGQKLADRLSQNASFMLAIQTCKTLSVAYSHSLSSVKKDAGPTTADGLRKANKIWCKLQEEDWKLSQQIFRLIGLPKSGVSKIAVSHPEESEIRRYIGDFEQLVCKVPMGLTVKHISHDGHSKGFQRSYFTDSKNTAYIRDNPGRGVIWHEIGHALEHNVPGLEEAVSTYLADRTKGETAKKLQQVERPGYTLMEKAKADGFVQPYCGKIYNDGGTEILSMGLQYLCEDPSTLWLEDRDMFSFVLGCVAAARGSI
jgi:hypothetical protein